MIVDCGRSKKLDLGVASVEEHGMLGISSNHPRGTMFKKKDKRDTIPNDLEWYDIWELQGMKMTKNLSYEDLARLDRAIAAIRVK